MIYPPNPMPNYVWEGKMEKKSLMTRMSKMVSDSSVILSKDNVDAFLTSDPTKPKVVLFTNKDKAPLIFKALSSETVFRRTIKFGLVKESEAEIVSRFKVKKFPSFLSVSGPKADQREIYKGEMNF